MTDADRVARRLDDLAEFCADAAYTVLQGRDAYLADTAAGRVLRNNGRQIVIQVATVVERLPVSFKDRFPDVEWTRIQRMRNLIAHHYDGVDDALVFTALQRRIPELAAALGLDGAAG